MLLEVMLDNRRWIVDAGFGGLCPSAPPRLDDQNMQSNAHGDCLITPHDGRYIVNASIDGEQRMLYTFGRQPQRRLTLEGHRGVIYRKR